MAAMSNENSTDQSSAGTAQEQVQISVGRRRLLRGSLGAAPVLATFVSQPVHATYACKTASAHLSMNASRPGATVTPCSGAGPVWWKNNCPGGAWTGTGCVSSTLFTSCFAATTLCTSGRTMMQVLTSKDQNNAGVADSDKEKLARNMVAAWLCLKAGTISRNAFSESVLQKMWTDAHGAGYAPIVGSAVLWNPTALNAYFNAQAFPAAV